ncbi:MULTISPECIES: hypothetical protein [unclassified Parabacteroides]|jgi:hypothetical protein|uniref:hypothetical protein n=1 Tax=unclassified Parabacteroides TaxID=2649774 RepID=UPI000EFF9D61|nr:hypothetical protein [Parabacteroides sp. TM07-1AC]RHU24651.1 hypothetical protein DXD68_16140 [Parabacteroides sp. TM07-1AC]
MKHLVLLLFVAFLCNVNNAFASEMENTPSNENNTTWIVSLSSENHVDYRISNISYSYDSYGYVEKVNFTVSWQYTGPLTNPQVVYIVNIKSGYFDNDLGSFQDSAIGKPSGTKEYSIKLKSPHSSSDIYLSIYGSDGGFD